MDKRTDERKDGHQAKTDGRTDICPSDEACAVTCALQLFWNMLQVKCPFSVQMDSSIDR